MASKTFDEVAAAGALIGRAGLSGHLERATMGTEQIDDRFAELYDMAWLQMVRLAALVSGDRATAEDIAQDAFVNVYRRWKQLSRDARDPLPYVRMAVINTARSSLRTARRRLTSLGLEQGAPAPSVPPGDNDFVLEALYALPRRQVEVLVLRYWLDLSEADIAQTLGISPGTVKSTASRAIAALHFRLSGMA